ncbi:disease resistance protein RPP8-like isoform X2 [Gossypium australe]|uniref:Disease resistance protein RPP8-like isoform X2 n=1 Tax=Gossypium australe TaxID=47621 RepID=A0A5B6WKL5_9ROSI|nr:disease resistance protein RPP8-like isoform X2 [Gossypium australe]
MPRVRSLLLYGILNLEMLPPDLRYNTTLQELKLKEMKRLLIEHTKGEDCYKVCYIPSINMTEYRKNDDDCICHFLLDECNLMIDTEMRLVEIGCCFV